MPLSPFYESPPAGQRLARLCFAKNEATLDAAIAGLAGLALAWIYLITPTLTQQEISLPVRLALSSYPAVSIFLLVIGFRFATGWGSKPPFAFYSLLVALASMLVGDVVYMLVEMNLIEVASWIDLPYGMGFVAWATTATRSRPRRSSSSAAAVTADWDRAALERQNPEPGR